MGLDNAKQAVAFNRLKNAIEEVKNGVVVSTDEVTFEFLEITELDKYEIILAINENMLYSSTKAELDEMARTKTVAEMVKWIIKKDK